MNDFKVFNLLRHFRFLYAFSQKDLAKLSNVSQATISGIESGKIQYPVPTTRKKLATAFEINVSELFFPDENSMTRYLASR